MIVTHAMNIRRTRRLRYARNLRRSIDRHPILSAALVCAATLAALSAVTPSPASVPRSPLDNVMLVRSVLNPTTERYDYYVDDVSLTVDDCLAALRARTNDPFVSYACEFSTDTE